MTNAGEPEADCYSQGERHWMVYTQRLRGVWMAPLLTLMARAKIKPDHLTILSLTAGLAFCPLYVPAFPVALACLALHVLLDGMDGPLARHLGIASRSGSFTDTMADQTVITATTLTAVFYGTVHFLPGTLYILTYTVVVLFAMARNALKTPYSWLFRPRFLVYVWIAVDQYLLPGTLNYVIWGCVVLLGAKTLSGFVRIRKRI